MVQAVRGHSAATIRTGRVTTTSPTAAVRPDEISLIVPVRNEAATLGSFLDSLSQSVAPLEMIFVDAGSTDDSAQLLRSAESPGIRLVEAGPAFPGRARNIGIQQATTPWIAMTDAGT